MFPERVQQMHEDREKKFEFEYNVSVCRQVYYTSVYITVVKLIWVKMACNNPFV